MTDKNGETHPWTNQHPPQPLIDKQRSYAKEVLPPQFAELVELTDKPFIQAVTDVLSPHCVFHQGRIVLCGDAVAGFRPHTAASTSQAAFHALQLDKYLRQEQVDWDRFEGEILEYARNGVEHGIKLGNRSQFQKHPMSA
jgi:2-polyprenyl-6-methoxyphenol hydroxylase-like FAD-dependent oxidoreductase